MDIQKPNDIFVATINNPEVTPYDLLSNDINGDNTSLLSPDDYKKSNYVQNAFKDKDGKFDDVAFNQAYASAKSKFAAMTDDQYLKGLDEVEYSPFDIARPKFAKTFNVDATVEKEYNPLKELRGWTGSGSIDTNPLSLREIAQQNKVYDPSTGTWSKESLNDLSILDKLFGSTIVYAQYDSDGTHIDPNTGMMITHRKGDWKEDSDGNIYTEKLAGREIYGKQVVNPMDILTTDGSLANKFDFMDSDGREKSVAGTAFKIASEIAPMFIPVVGSYYVGVKAAVGMAAVLPTLYKSLEGMLTGDSGTTLTKGATKLEGWLSKYNTESFSDEAEASTFNFEKLSSSVAGLFTLVSEQNAVAGLSKMIYRTKPAEEAAAEKLANGLRNKLAESVVKGETDITTQAEFEETLNSALRKIPELQESLKKQSSLAKTLSLAYMSLTSTADLYAQAVEGGYDRRTAGFAALAGAATQYGVMVNNRLGDWFLNTTTGYTTGTNNALMRKGVMPFLNEIEEVFNREEGSALGSAEASAAKTAAVSIEKKKALAGVFKKIKNSVNDIFMTPSVFGEEMIKNAVTSGFGAVSMQAVTDATTGIIDVMSNLGLTKKKGSFGTVDRLLSSEGAEGYLSNFVSGIVGGGLFELQHVHQMPRIDPSNLSAESQKLIYETVAAGEKDKLIKVINQLKPKLANKYITPIAGDGSFEAVTKDNGISQADLVANKAIEVINTVDGILNNHNLIHSDEEIINKTLRDKILINKLKKTAPAGKIIGIEGLVLEDYKKKMARIVDISNQINKLEVPEEAPKTKEGETAPPKKESKVPKTQLDALKRVLADDIADINKIISGEMGPEYLKQATFYLNKKISEPYIHMDKASYVEDAYGVKLADLPEEGLGLTQKRVDDEWHSYIESKDLRNDLEIATAEYSKHEKLLNPFIADYANSGYSEERKKTINNIMDLKSTIDQFNTASDEATKNALLERYIYINNEIQKSGYPLVAPWEALQTDMYDQLDNLGLLKKIGYKRDENGKLVETLSNFTKDELESPDEVTGLSKKDAHKKMVMEYFKQFPLNPMNAEKIIDLFNSSISVDNSKILRQIDDLSNKAEKTEEDIQKINQLKRSLFDMKIDSFNNTELIKGIRLSASSEKIALLENANIESKDFDKYVKIKNNANLYSKSFDDIIKEDFDTKDWKTLNQEGLSKIIKKLSETTPEIYVEALNDLSKISSNSRDEINNDITRLNDETLTVEELNGIKDHLEKFFDVYSSILNKGNEVLKNPVLENLYNKSLQIDNNLSKKINELKPGILKMHNYAFDLLLKSLNSGNADREVFLITEKLYKDESKNFVASIFPNGKDIDYKEFPSLFESAKKFNENLDKEYELELAGEPDAYNEYYTLGEVLKNEGNKEENIFGNEAFKNFLKNNFDEDTTLGTIQIALSDASKSFNNQSDEFKRLNKFVDLQSSGIKLKSNALYDFIRKFTLNLDSNPNSKVNKIFDILEREETTLKSASNITNYTSDGIRDSDIKQAINELGMIKSVVNAMSTTTVDYGDPVGFIAARKNFVERYKLKDDVSSLKTITSDIAELMGQDIDVLTTKLTFLKDLAVFNASKVMNEQEAIRTKVNSILLNNWDYWSNKINPAFLPVEKIKSILLTNDSNDKKLMDIETAVFDHNQGKKIEAFSDFLKKMVRVDSDDVTRVDRDVKSLKNWDLAVYYATVLSSRAEDFYIRSYKTINGEFSKAPFFTQEFAARITKASTAEPELFAKIFELKPNSLKTTCDFITYILGGAGVGKTSVVFGLFLDNFRQTNEATNMWLSAPADLQVNNLEDAIKNSVGNDKMTSSKYTKSELFDKLGLTQMISDIETEIANVNDPKRIGKYIALKDGYLTLTDEVTNNNWISGIANNLKDLPNLLLIDEATHYSFAEMYLLNAISKYSYNSDTIPFMKIVAAGDPTQLGYLAKIEGKSYDYSAGAINSIFTPRLWSTVRASNNQKRINNDRLIKITQKLEDIYNENTGNPDLANAQGMKYLESNQDLNMLSYYESDDALTGDKIVSELDKNTLEKLSKVIASNPDTIIGILTEDGKLPENWNKALSDAGIINPSGMPNVRLFNPYNIQGSEVDYFIFDSDLTTKYDKLRDNLKALYTFVSRSKVATIIVDPNKVLDDNYKISNGRKDSYTTTFEPMTSEVIAKAKERRSGDLERLIKKDAVPSIYDNFKWKVGTTKELEEPILDSVPVTSRKDLIEPMADQIGTKQESQEKSEETKDDKFKVMIHSFYNNPGAIIENDKIISNPNNPYFDLNLTHGTDSAKETDQVIHSWLSLKNHILSHLKDNYVLSTNYTDFLKKVFLELEDGTSENISIEPVMTVTRFNSDINKPYKKKGFKAEDMLKDGDLFINLSAKLTFGGKSHYITLATLGTEAKIIKKASESGYDYKDVTKKFTNLSTALNNAEKSGKNMIELSLSNIDSIRYSTKTLLTKITKGVSGENREEYDLSTLHDEFPAHYFSEIRFYPGEESAFKNLLRKYTFGNPRTIGTDITDTFTQEKWNEEFNRLKNKPYIVVSPTAEEIEGDPTGKRTQATLIPVGSNSRGLDVLTQEVTNLLKERKAEIERQKQENPNITPVMSPELNAKTEALLNRSNILDVLIKWGTTKEGDGTLLDLLDKKITFGIENTLTGNKTSVFEIFNRFKTNSKPVTSEKFKLVIDKVRRKIAENPDNTPNRMYNIKKDVINDLKGTTGWHWSFFNIFGYENIVGSKADNDLLKLISEGTLTDEDIAAFNKDNGTKEMKETLNKLVTAINDYKFYYSVPIKPAEFQGGPLISNPFIGGKIKGKFDKEFFGDKFFINVAPESGRLLMDVDTFLNSKLKTNQEVSKEKIQEKVPVEEPVVKEVPIEPINSRGDLINAMVDSLVGASPEDIQSFRELSVNLFRYVPDEIKANIANLVQMDEGYKLRDNDQKIQSILQEIGFNGKYDNKTIAKVLNLGEDPNNQAIEIKRNIKDLLKLCK